MKTNQIKKKKAKAVILSLLYSKEVSHCHLHFGRNAKAGGGVGKIYSGKKKASGVPWLEAIGLGKL